MDIGVSVGSLWRSDNGILCEVVRVLYASSLDEEDGDGKRYTIVSYREVYTSSNASHFKASGSMYMDDFLKRFKFSTSDEV